jgi:cystathionine beta-synthase
METLDENAVVVVILPDTGERYLSKVHSDEWLSDNGMLDPAEVLVGDLLRMKRAAVPDLITIARDATVRGALDLIRKHNISQIPVVNGEKRVVGTVLESTLMKGLLDGKVASDDPVSSIMDPPLPRVAAGDPVSQALQIMADRRSALLVEDDGGRLAGIVSHFDLIGFAAR